MNFKFIDRLKIILNKFTFNENVNFCSCSYIFYSLSVELFAFARSVKNDVDVEVFITKAIQV